MFRSRCENLWGGNYDFSVGIAKKNRHAIGKSNGPYGQVLADLEMRLGKDLNGKLLFGFFSAFVKISKVDERMIEVVLTILGNILL